MLSLLITERLALVSLIRKDWNYWDLHVGTIIEVWLYGVDFRRKDEASQFKRVRFDKQEENLEDAELFTYRELAEMGDN